MGNVFGTNTDKNISIKIDILKIISIKTEILKIILLIITTDKNFYERHIPQTMSMLRSIQKLLQSNKNKHKDQSKEPIDQLRQVIQDLSNEVWEIPGTNIERCKSKASIAPSRSHFSCDKLDTFWKEIRCIPIYVIEF